MKVIALLVVFSLSACSGMKWKSSKKIFIDRGISSTKEERIGRKALPQRIQWSKGLSSRRGYDVDKSSIVSYRVIDRTLLKYDMNKRYTKNESFWSRLQNENTTGYPSTNAVSEPCVAKFSGTLLKYDTSTSSRMKNGDYRVLRYTGGVQVSWSGEGDNTESGVDYTKGQYILATYTRPSHDAPNNTRPTTNDDEISSITCKTGDKILLSKKHFEQMVKINKNLKLPQASTVLNRKTLPQKIKWKSRKSSHYGSSQSLYKVTEGLLLKYNFTNRYDKKISPTKGSVGYDIADYPSTEELSKLCVADFSGTLSKYNISTSSKGSNDGYHVDRNADGSVKSVYYQGGNNVDSTQGQYILATYTRSSGYVDTRPSGFDTRPSGYVDTRPSGFDTRPSGYAPYITCKTGDKILLSKKQFKRMVKISNK